MLKMELEWTRIGFLFLCALATLLPSSIAVPPFELGCPPGSQQLNDKCRNKIIDLLEISKYGRTCKDLSADFNRCFNCVINVAEKCKDSSRYLDSYLSFYNRELSRVGCPTLLKQSAVPTNAKEHNSQLSDVLFLSFPKLY